MYCGIGQWIWVDDPVMGKYWTPPNGLESATDLRSLSEQSQVGQSNGDAGGPCMVFSAQPLGSEFVVIGEGDPRETKTNDSMRSAFKIGTGWDAEGDTLARLIYNLFTAGSAPDGATVRPLMPNIKSQLSINIHGLGCIWNEIFSYGNHTHTNRIQDVERLTYRNALDHAQTDCNRKLLGMLGYKYGISNPEDYFIPVDLPKVTAEQPETTYSDDFNRTDSTGLGGSWTALLNNINVSSNATLRTNTGVDCVCRYDSDLSGTDHFGQSTVSGSGAGHGHHGPITRKDGTATVTCYIHTVSNGASTAAVQKLVASTLTSLGSTAITWSSGQVVRGNSNGSTIDVFQDTVSRVSLTDTAITTGLRGGLYARGTAMMSGGNDTWSTEDLSVAFTPKQRRTFGFDPKLGTRSSY